MRKRFLTNRWVLFVPLAILLSLCLVLSAGLLSGGLAFAAEVQTLENSWEKEPEFVRHVTDSGTGEGNELVPEKAEGWTKGLLDISYTVTAEAKYGNENTYIRVYGETDNGLEPVEFSQGITLGGTTDKEAFRLGSDGLIPEYVIQTLNTLDEGKYYLLVVVPEGAVFEGDEVQYEYTGINDGSPTDEYVKANGVHLTVTDMGIPSELEVSIVGWTWGEYSSYLNVISINLSEPYVTQVEYTVYRDNNGTAGSIASGLSSFKTNEEGVAEDSAVQAFLKLVAGNYWLTARLNVNGKTISATVPFKVAKSENSWDVLPGALQWTWGEFDANVNKINGKASYAGAELTYSVYLEDHTPLEGLGQFTVASDGTIPSDVAKVLNSLDAGTYYIRCQSSNSNYDDIDEFIMVTVTPVQNIWEDVPSLVGWSEGSFKASENVFNGKAKLGSVKFTILNEKDKVLYTVNKESNGTITVYNANGERVSINRLNKLSAGTYRLVAEVEGTNNYTALKNSIDFVIADDAVALGGIIAATVVFAVIDVAAAAVCITLLIKRRRKIEQQFKMMVNKELHGR